MGPDGGLHEYKLDCWLIAAAMILAALLLCQGGRWVLAKCLTGRVAWPALSDSGSAQPAGSAELGKYKSIIEKGLFATPKPQPQLVGVIGETALLGNSPDAAKPYKQGAKLPTGETLKEIRPNAVVLEKDGKTQTLTLFPELPAAKKPPATPPPAQAKGGPGPAKTSAGAPSAPVK